MFRMLRVAFALSASFAATVSALSQPNIVKQPADFSVSLGEAARVDTIRIERMTIPNHNLMQFFLLFSPDGSTLATPAPNASLKHGNVSVWRAPSFKEIADQQTMRERKQ